MDLATLITNVALLVLTGIAAIIAWRQATVAMSARADAIQANADAKKAEEAALAAAARSASAAEASALSQARSAQAAERSAGSGERAAAALEQQVALTEKSLAPPIGPWSAEHHRDNIWHIVNRTGRVVNWAQIDSPLGFNEDRIESEKDMWDDVEPDGILVVRVIKHFTVMTLIVRWSDPEDLQVARTHPLTIRPT